MSNETKYPRLSNNAEGYIVTALHGYEHVVLSSLPGVCPVKGTKGDYGCDPDANFALVFPTRERAAWHSKRFCRLSLTRHQIRYIPAIPD